LNIFINISHPAHVHFFKNAITLLKSRGHKVIVGARKKEFTIDLLKAYNIDFTLLTKKGVGFWGLLMELALQQLFLTKLIFNKKIDLMLQIGGIFNAPVGKIFRIPTLAISDTENDKFGNKISFMLSKHVLLPTCFDHQIGGEWDRQIHYPGYHELAYLAPRYLSEIKKPEAKFLIRFVGWGAGHDIGEKWLSDKQKIEIVQCLNRYGRVYISSEMSLPQELQPYICQIHPGDIHDFMKDCKLIVGESATMASEAACLGIPAIFISNTGRGYTTEEDQKYHLIKHYNLAQWDEIMKRLYLWAESDLWEEWQKKRFVMLKEKIDVTAWLVDLVEQYPESIPQAVKGDFTRYYL
jgi:uncharacterized protein